jgi:hypothetical protein
MPHATKELYLPIELNIVLAILQLWAHKQLRYCSLLLPWPTKPNQMAFEGWQGSTYIVATLKLTKIA